MSGDGSAFCKSAVRALWRYTRGRSFDRCRAVERWRTGIPTMQIPRSSQVPQFDHCAAVLPPRRAASVSLHTQILQGTPWKGRGHENWGIFKRHFWVVHVRHAQVRRAQVKETRDDVPRVSLIGNPFLGRRSSKGGFFCGRPFCRGPSPGFRLSFVTGVRGKRSGSILKGTLFFVHTVCFTKRLHHVLWVHHDAWRNCYQRRNLQVQEHRNISSEGHTIVEKGVPRTFVSFPLL